MRHGRRDERLAETLGDLSDAGERCTKIALDVDREGFERRQYSTRQRRAFAGCGENIRRSRHHRNAVSVLPLPVGARISVDSPRAIGGQPSACGAVGSSKAAVNQARTGE